MNRGSPRSLGLVPVAASACRQALADQLAGHDEALRGHLAACAACRGKFEAARVLSEVLRKRPAVPPELESRALLDAVFERAVADFEQSPLVAELGRGVPSPGAAIEAPPPELLESATARAVLSSVPGPSDVTWARVRRSVRADAQSVLSKQQALKRWPMIVAVVAASVVITFVVLGREELPAKITFTDLSAPPAVEMTILRHGPGH